MQFSKAPKDELVGFWWLSNAGCGSIVPGWIRARTKKFYLIYTCSSGDSTHVGGLLQGLKKSLNSPTQCFLLALGSEG